MGVPLNAQGLIGLTGADILAPCKADTSVLFGKITTLPAMVRDKARLGKGLDAADAIYSRAVERCCAGKLAPVPVSLAENLESRLSPRLYSGAQEGRGKMERAETAALLASIKQFPRGDILK